jgi:radical SAM-linked protein
VSDASPTGDPARGASGPARDEAPGEAGTPPAPPPEPRQRWRLTLARDATVADVTQREVADAWEAAILGTDLPVARTADARSRARIAFGAPLPTGVAAEAEWLELVLTERWPRWRVREALAPVIPAGWTLVELEDVWLGGPSLAGRVAAADYRARLDASTVPEPAALAAAAARLLAAQSIPRDRQKGDRVVSYDLRPLLLDVDVDDTRPPTIRIRVRIHPELGTGRPEEVIAALAAEAGTAITVAELTRERLLLADELNSAPVADRPG